MHLALAASDEFPDFAPEPTDVGQWRWIEKAMHPERAFDALKQRRDATRMPLVDRLSAQRDALPCLNALLPAGIDGLKIRHHGNFHLGQMLIVKDDIFIIDFTGQPDRPLEERRRKAPAARDVAGLIRSIDYSAAALERALKVTPDEHGRLGAALFGWRDRSAAAFLAAYREAMTDSHLWARRPPNGCLVSSCSTSRSTRSNTKWLIGQTGCASR